MKFLTSLKQVITITSIALVSLSTNAQTVEVIKAEPVNKVEFKRDVELKFTTTLQQQIVVPAMVKFELPNAVKTANTDSQFKLPAKLAMIAE